jgi:integrase
MPTTKLPFIPTEQEIDLLIAGCGKVTASVLQTLKETGMRIGELILLTWLDVDTERKTVSITPEKNSNPRILPISDKLIGMLNSLPRKHKTIFQPKKQMLRSYLCIQRKAVAEKFKNPRIQQISFHTLRHWKGTMEYHRTKDIMHVKYVLGHKAVTSTQIYVNLESALFLQTNDNFTCKVAHNVEEATQLIEAGFDYVTEIDKLKLFKKRK